MSFAEQDVLIVAKIQRWHSTIAPVFLTTFVVTIHSSPQTPEPKATVSQMIVFLRVP
jgi:hypothetical protein